MTRRNDGIPPSRVDFGGWSEHYASRPYANFKFEVYPLFVDILASLPDAIRVLDIGAGPGHLAFEFFRTHPKATAQFTLIDSSVKLLEHAASRLSSQDSQIRTLHRSIELPNWDAGLGKFDAIVSNNVPFPVEPKAMGSFYRTCFTRLKKNGIFLVQEPCSYSGSANPYGGDPLSDFLSGLPSGILPGSPPMSQRERKRLEAEKQQAIAKHREAIAQAQADGVVFPPETGWQFATVDAHLASLRDAGFVPGCIWRKKASAVLLAVKGNPKLRTQT